MNRAWLLTALLFIASCSRPPAVDSIHASVVRALQDGELKQAQDLLDQAFGVGKLLQPPGRPDPLLAAGISQSDAERLRLLQSEILLEQGKAPAALSLLDEIKDPGNPESHLRWLVNRAVALSKTDRIDQSNTVLDQVDRETGNLAASEPVLKAHLLRGGLLIRSRQFDQADALFRETAGIAQDSHLPFYRAAALLNLSLSSQRRRRYDESVEYALQSLNSGNRRLEPAIHNNLGIAYYRLGNLERAEDHENQAVVQSEKSGDTRTLADALGGLANVKMGLGKPEAAVTALERAVDISKRFGANSDVYRWAGNLATAHILAADALIRAGQSDAEKRAEAELAAAEKANDEAYRFRGLLEHAEKPLLLQFNAAEIAFGRNQFPKAEEFYNALIAEKPEGFLNWNAHARLGRLYASWKRYPQAKAEYKLALSAIDDERSSLNRAEFQITFNDYLIRFFDNYVDMLISEGQIDEALAVVEYSRARVMAEKLGLEPQSMRSVRTAAFRTYARQSGDAMLSYWLSPEHSYVWVVTADGIHMKELPPKARIAEAISVYRRMIEQDLRDPVSENLAQGEELSNLLLGPVKPYLERARRVIVVPDGELHMLNLETLPVASAAGVRYWIETAEIAITPSLVLLSGTPSSSSSPSAASANSAVLLFGAPTSSRKEYPELPGARSEIDGIRQLFGRSDKDNRIVTGADATPRGFLDSMPTRYSIIHFAAHAESNPESPLDSAIILSDEGHGRGFKLYARDIANLKLSTDLVTISACRSAVGRSYNGEGMVGFAWAFMQSGVRTVIAGLWDVDDNYSSQLMTTLYKGIASGMKPSKALRAAKLELLHSSGAQSKPAYWAPFQTYLR